MGITIKTFELVAVCAISIHADYDYFKMLLADAGLFITLAFMDCD